MTPVKTARSGAGDNGPHSTSYPTADRFHAGVTAATYLDAGTLPVMRGVKLNADDLIRIVAMPFDRYLREAREQAKYSRAI